MSWVMAAVASAFFAGITSILAKCGLSETDSDVATALRTLVVLVFAWVMVAAVGSGHTIAQITSRSWLSLYSHLRGVVCSMRRSASVCNNAPACMSLRMRAGAPCFRRAAPSAFDGA